MAEDESESGFLRHIYRCNQHVTADFSPFLIHGKVVGRIRHEFAQALLGWPALFRQTVAGIELRFASAELSQRSAALAEVVGQLCDTGVIHYLHGEQYAITTGDGTQTMVLVDRSAATYFGVSSFGQHINGYVKRKSGLAMWIGRRASDRRLYPGCLDQMVAGGLPYGLSLQQNLQKECWEEAGIPPALADKARATGFVTYHTDTPEGFKSDLLYCYDLILPADFTPCCTDGEVAEFELLPIEHVMDLVRNSDSFKPNCNLVLIDFFIRHGYLAPEDSGYKALTQGLRPVLVQESV